MSKSISYKQYRYFSVILFALLFVYILLRAYYISPLHDELATFFHYIETGRIFGEGIVQDANNHLLNSYLGRALYLIFGENFFIMRLPNVLAFSLYFWGIQRICRNFNTRYYSIIVLTGLTTIPYLLDYFAYLRGYGLALGFFIWMLIFFQQWIKDPSPKNALLVYFFSYCAVFANLTYIVSCFFMIGLLMLVQLIRWRKYANREHFMLFLVHGSLLLTLLPFIWFTYLLKNGGALYYGSLKGLWEVTGKSLSRYVLFTDYSLLKWVFIVLLMILGRKLLLQVYKRSFIATFRQMKFIVPVFLFGNLCAILFFAFFLNVNYPEDRTGMYLVPLFILSLLFVLYEYDKLRWTIILVLFFPISLILDLNLSTSIYSPDQRMSDSFYTKVRKEVTPESTIAGYPLMVLTWPLHERHVIEDPVMLNPRRIFSPYFDLVLTKTTITSLNRWIDEYDTLAYDPETTHIAFKRKRPLLKTPVMDIPVSFSKNRNEYTDLFHLPLNDSLNNQVLQICITGELVTENNFDNISIVFSSNDAQGNRVNYESFNQRWYQKSKTNEFTINLNYVHTEASIQEHDLIIYVWNPQKSPIQFNHARMKVTILKRTKSTEPDTNSPKKT
jgi:hypothetical protein